MKTTIRPMFLTAHRDAVAYITIDHDKQYDIIDRFVRVGQVVWC